MPTLTPEVNHLSTCAQPEIAFFELFAFFVVNLSSVFRLNMEREVGFNRSTRRARSQNDLRTLEMGLTTHPMGEWLRVASQAQVLPLRAPRVLLSHLTASFRLIAVLVAARDFRDRPGANCAGLHGCRRLAIRAVGPRQNYFAWPKRDTQSLDCSGPTASALDGATRMIY